ncbi:MAG: glucose-1-phosphate adenylyltransferase [Deltaproteobacteria bacterium]|nr:glucose-1-phosphate adenylyltransferase [Deltaproteobacteria bacterium]
MPSTGIAYDLNTALRSTMAIVLAGGRGSRLMHLTDNLAKPAVPFGGKFRIIDFPLSNCLNSGIRRIGVITQYKSHHLIQHVQQGWGFLRGELNEFVQIWPAQQQTSAQTWYLGTADSVFQNLETLRDNRPEYILILAGDHIYRQDYSRLLAEHISRKADISVSCVEVDIEKASDFGVVEVDETDAIVDFKEKPPVPKPIPGLPGKAFASMGIYLFNAEVLYKELHINATLDSSHHDFGHDILPSLIAQPRYRLFAHRFPKSSIKSSNGGAPYWRDVGTVDAYWESNVDLVMVTPALDLYDRIWPIFTYQAQRPAAKFVFDDEGRRGMAVDSVVSAGCVISGATVRRSLLFTDVIAHSFSRIEDSVILPGGQIGRYARLNKVIVGEGCQIPQRLIVGEDPVQDAQRFFRTEKGVTLISKEMVARL